MKKYLALVLLLCEVFTLCACSRQAATETLVAAEKTVSEPDLNMVYECVAALHTTAGAIEDQTVQKFAQLVSEKTSGHVDVQIFAGASLGTEQENIEQIKENKVQFALFGDVFLAQILQSYNASSIPFVFNNIDDVIEYWTSVEDIIDPIVLENKMYIIGREYRAPRQLTANKAIIIPEDLAGLKLRVPQTEFYIKTWSDLGAIPISIDWSDTFNALQTGAADAQENPIETYYAAGLCEVQTHTMLTNHINTFYTWTVNSDWFDSLPAEYQEAVREAAEEALEEANACLMERQNEIIEQMAAEGHIIVDIDTSLFREAAMDSIIECADTLALEARAAVYAQLGLDMPSR